MKPSLKIGQTAEVEFNVTADMFAQFGGQVVHELLSTSALVQYMEWAARKTILPHLQPEEEGMGARVEIQHLMLTPKNVAIKITARVTAIKDNKVECAVEAANFRGKVARGVVVQAIVQKAWLQQKIREMEVVEGIIEHDHVINNS